MIVYQTVGCAVGFITPNMNSFYQAWTEGQTLILMPVKATWEICHL